jgi:hypothetical protein
MKSSKESCESVRERNSIYLIRYCKHVTNINMLVLAVVCEIRDYYLRFSHLPEMLSAVLERVC